MNIMTLINTQHTQYIQIYTHNIYKYTHNIYKYTCVHDLPLHKESREKVIGTNNIQTLLQTRDDVINNNLLLLINDVTCMYLAASIRGVQPALF